MRSTAAAELGVAADVVATYRQRVADLVGPSLGPNAEDLVAAIYEAERSLRTAERVLQRARKVAES